MTTFVTAVEVRTTKQSQTTVWEMPVTVEKRDDLTAIVFSTEAGIFPVVTILLTESDKRDLIRMLGGRKR